MRVAVSQHQQSVVFSRTPGNYWTITSVKLGVKGVSELTSTMTHQVVTCVMTQSWYYDYRLVNRLARGPAGSWRITLSANFDQGGHPGPSAGTFPIPPTRNGRQ